MLQSCACFSLPSSPFLWNLPQFFRLVVGSAVSGLAIPSLPSMLTPNTLALTTLRKMVLLKKLLQVAVLFEPFFPSLWSFVSKLLLESTTHSHLFRSKLSRPHQRGPSLLLVCPEWTNRLLVLSSIGLGQVSGYVANKPEQWRRRCR